jgi:predicted lipid-binding transport protein (Tim44 family)
MQMAATKEAKAQASDADSKGEVGDADAAPAGPSVAAHPRAALHVARAKGWGGLLGFLLGGYLSLPTSTLAAAGLRALVAGMVCYLVAWAGAVFVWRQLVMLQVAGARSRKREHLESLAGATSAPDTGGAGRRQNVRVRVERPVVAYIGANRTPAHTFTIDISAGGLLVAGLADLQKGEPFDFELTLAPGDPPVTGTGSVVRTDPQGRCAIVFKRITRADERRLDQFIFESLRSERQGGPP